MMGTLLMGLSFGSFYTVIVPMVNEMYGNLEFGKMWGAQITSQAMNVGFLEVFGEVDGWQNHLPPPRWFCDKIYGWTQFAAKLLTHGFYLYSI